jgi:hypothetical protein
MQAVHQLAVHLRGKGLEHASLEAKDLFLQVFCALIFQASLFVYFYTVHQLLQRQEREGCSSADIAETLSSLWDAWYRISNRSLLLFSSGISFV